MTLTTHIFITGTGVTQRDVYDKVNDLLTIPATRRFREGPNSRYWYRGDHEISNEIGQGFPAIVDTFANRDGSLIAPKHAADCDPECDAHVCTIPHHVHLRLDTSYGYDDERGWSVSQLHAWVIATLVGWLAPKSCSLIWIDEYTATAHEGTDHLDEFLGSGRAAQAWFRDTVLPAIASAGGAAT